MAAGAAAKMILMDFAVISPDRELPNRWKFITVPLSCIKAQFRKRNLETRFG